MTEKKKEKNFEKERHLIGQSEKRKICILSVIFPPIKIFQKMAKKEIRRASGVNSF